MPAAGDSNAVRSGDGYVTGIVDVLYSEDSSRDVSPADYYEALKVRTSMAGETWCDRKEYGRNRAPSCALGPDSEIHPKRIRVLVPEPLFRAVEMFEIVSPERFRFFNDGLPIDRVGMPVNLWRTENRKVKRHQKLPLRFHFQKDSIRFNAFSPP